MPNQPARRNYGRRIGQHEDHQNMANEASTIHQEIKERFAERRQQVDEEHRPRWYLPERFNEAKRSALPHEHASLTRQEAFEHASVDISFWEQHVTRIENGNRQFPANSVLDGYRRARGALLVAGPVNLQTMSEADDDVDHVERRLGLSTPSSLLPAPRTTRRLAPIPARNIRPGATRSASNSANPNALLASNNLQNTTLPQGQPRTPPATTPKWSDNRTPTPPPRRPPLPLAIDLPLDFDRTPFQLPDRQPGNTTALLDRTAANNPNQPLLRELHAVSASKN